MFKKAILHHNTLNYRHHGDDMARDYDTDLDIDKKASEWFHLDSVMDYGHVVIVIANG